MRLNIRYYTDFPTCNFHCTYCVAGHGDAYAKPQSQWDEERFKVIINNICQLPYDINIRLGVGGEFFISKLLVDGARKLSNQHNVHSVNLITNLSFSVAQYDKVFKGFDQSKIALVASFHPTEVNDHEGWFHKAATLNQKYDFAVIMVGFPDFFDQLQDYKNYLNALGVEVFIQPFVGPLNGKHYPQDYSEEQRKLLREMIYSRHDYEYLVNVKRPGLCNAGYKSLFVNPVGHVFPCGMGHWEEKLGDFTQSPALELGTVPLPCPFNSCQCDTENMNTVDFEQHYEWTDKNQHKYRYRFQKQALTDPRMAEWAIRY